MNHDTPRHANSTTSRYTEDVLLTHKRPAQYTSQHFFLIHRHNGYSCRVEKCNREYGNELLIDTHVVSVFFVTHHCFSSASKHTKHPCIAKFD